MSIEECRKQQKMVNEWDKKVDTLEMVELSKCC